MGLKLSDKYKVMKALEPQEIASGATADGASLNVVGYDRALVLLNVGVLGASGSLAVVVTEDAVGGSTFADTIATHAAILTADDQALYLMDISLADSAGLIRVEATITGGTATALVAAEVIPYNGNPPSIPVTQDETVEYV